ncbi:hypothetical protein MMC06_004769, partial [Schaereria dolodes]|nr:hypothetical protein [Schaereria dolodes]
MFHRRRAQSNPHARTQPTAAATTAAAQAFLANRASNATLSSAAAAAALRSHTTTPVPISEVQTKRMLQRRGSASSNGSAGSIHRPGVLQRQSSFGSMTDRTFREPSPNRGTTQRSQRDEQPPPVPELPWDYQFAPPIPVKSKRRPASVEPPERLNSPPPRLPGGRGVSLDRGPGVMPGRQSRPGTRVTSLGNVKELERNYSRESVNFSRPMSPPNASPTSPSNGERQAASKPDAVAISASEANAIERSMQEAANGPVKKKKKVVVKSTADGSHLANRGVGGRPPASAVDESSRIQSSSNASPSNMLPLSQSGAEHIPDIPKKTKRRKAATSNTEMQAPRHGIIQTHYASDSDSVTEQSLTNERPRTFNTRAAGFLMKQPSIVREDREAEEQEEKGLSRLSRDEKVALLGSVEPQGTPTALNDELHNQSTSQSLSSSAMSHLDSQDMQNNNSSSNNSNVQRQPSLSPARAAHFSSQPSYEIIDGAKHQPPSRSLSPTKSALKHPPSSRGSSPAGQTPVGWNRRAPSEASDTTSLVSDDGYRSVPKKRNVRVSFDDDMVVVGRASSPPTSMESPAISSLQTKGKTKKSWFGLGREKKQSDEKDIEEIMKPTPALPSFGSVRDWKDHENASVTTPAETGENVQADPHYRRLEQTNQSSDHAVGAIISDDIASKNKTSVTGNKLVQLRNDPFPPEVTSVEGTGYNSDTEDSVYSTHNGDATQRCDLDTLRASEVTPQTTIAETAMTGTGLLYSSGNMYHHNERNSVPSISVQPATPGLEDSQRSSGDWFGMPGRFPISTDNLNEDPNLASELSHKTVKHEPTDPSPTTVGVVEPEAINAATERDPILPAAKEASHTLGQGIDSHADEESDDTGSSIYSDAAEDLSDVEGDGFGSINAIVESPPTQSSKGASTTLAGNLNGSKLSTKSLKRDAVTRTESEMSEPSSEQGWDKAQAYWSGLSEGRKQQLERAAATTDPTTVSKEKTRVVPRQVSQTTNATQSPKYSRTGQENMTTKFSKPRPSKKSMSSSQANESIHMRESMRNSQQDALEQPHMRSSMRNSAALKPSLRQDTQGEGISKLPKGPLQKKKRPVSATAMVDYNQTPRQTAPSQKNKTSDGSLSAIKPTIAQAKQKPLTNNAKIHRRKSNDSDSSSSFRRQRPSTSDGGRYSMKRSMRDLNSEERPKSLHANQSSAFSLRSSSPTESVARRPFSSSGLSMRTSMRDSIGSNPSRSAKSPKRSFGLGKEPKVKVAPASPFSSRFGGSSDEEVETKAYSSRFADSSDEDEPVELPANFTPVRGIPKRIDEGDSTDLEDSSEETFKRATTTKAASSKVSNMEGAALASGSLRRNGSGREFVKASDTGPGLLTTKAVEKEKKKKSFFG